MDIYFSLMYCYIHNIREISIFTLKKYINSKEKGNALFRENLKKIEELGLLYFFKKLEYKKGGKSILLIPDKQYFDLFFEYDRNSAVGFDLKMMAEIKHKNEKRLYIFILTYMRERDININIEKLKDICYKNKKTIRTMRYQFKKDIDKISLLFIDFKYEYYYVNNTERIRFT